MTKKTGASNNKGRGRKAGGKSLSSSEMPQRTLEDVIQIAQLIYKNFAGSETPLSTIASIIGIGEKSTNMTYAIKAAESYGIIDKTDKDTYKLAEVGRKMVAPTYPGESLEAKRQAIMTPTLMSKFYSDYDRHPIPESTFFLNALEQNYSIPKNKVAEVKDILLKNAEYAEIIVNSSDGGTQLINLKNESTQTEVEIYVPSRNETDITDVVEYTPHFVETVEGDFSKTCFIITPIGGENSEERKHANMMLNHLYEPICKELGISIVRADKIDKSGLITQQILEYIAKSKFCIADLSFNNPNVFYELGVRHVCQLPTVQIIRKVDKIPFDVSQGRTIVIDTSDIYTIMDRFKSAQNELREHLKKMMDNSQNDIAEDNPIKIYLPGLKVTLPK